MVTATNGMLVLPQAATNFRDYSYLGSTVFPSSHASNYAGGSLFFLCHRESIRAVARASFEEQYLESWGEAPGTPCSQYLRFTSIAVLSSPFPLPHLISAGSDYISTHTVSWLLYNPQTTPLTLSMVFTRWRVTMLGGPFLVLFGIALRVAKYVAVIIT